MHFKNIKIYHKDVPINQQLNKLKKVNKNIFLFVDPVRDVYTTTKYIQYVIHSFKHHGVKIVNHLKKINIYQTKSKFWKELKSNYVAWLFYLVGFFLSISF